MRSPQRAGRSREFLVECLDGSGGPSRRAVRPGGDGSPSLRPGEVVKPFQMSGRDQKALLECREDRKALLESWEGLGGPEEVGRPPGGPGGFESPFRRDGRDWEGRKSLGDHPNGRERPRNPSEKGRRSREALPDGWKNLRSFRRDRRPFHWT